MPADAEAGRRGRRAGSAPPTSAHHAHARRPSESRRATTASDSHPRTAAPRGSYVALTCIMLRMSDSEHVDTAGGGKLAHRLVPMTGRDPDEPGRVASPLELLFDLTFVVAVGTAAFQFAEMLAKGHATQALVAFVLAMFAISVAWISFTWFASAFGTDDWLYRVLTMLQMIGVVVFSLGLPAMFHSVEEGGHLELRAMVIGYVVMRIAMVFQWWRAARQSPSFHKVGLAGIRWTVTAQLGWIVVGFSELPSTAVFAAFIVLGALELLLPLLTQGGAGRTPWHPHHVAERYGLFAIITLGEGVVGTVASSGDLLGGADGTEWTANAIAVVVAGVGLTFGMWWGYFTTPFGDILARRRSRGYLFGYGHIPVYIGIAGAGAGLHVAGLHPGAPGEARRHRRGPLPGPPRRSLPADGVPPAHPAAHRRGPLPPAAHLPHARAAGRRGTHVHGRCPRRGVPARGHAGPVRHRDRLRDDRPPTPTPHAERSLFAESLTPRRRIRAVHEPNGIVERVRRENPETVCRR